MFCNYEVRRSGWKAMQLTQQVRVFPTGEQKSVLWDLAEKCRLVYNFGLQERKQAFKDTVKGVNYFKQQNDLPKLKEMFPEYKWVYSKVLQYTLRTLDADYKSFFALWKKGYRTARLPKFKGKKYFTTMVFNQSGFKHEKGSIELSHKHPSKTKLSFEIPEKFSFDKAYQAAVFRKDCNFYLSITFEKPEKKYKDNGLYQAFDLGITKHSAVNSKGKFIEFRNARPDKYWQKKLESIQSRRDHCKKGSRKWINLNKNLKRMKRKCSNQLKDFQHKLSRKIVNNTKANTLVIGRLSAKEMGKKKKGKQNNKSVRGLNRALQNTGLLARFVGFLTYKARLEGKRVIEINERNTSKKCCACGNKQEMPLYKRNYVCDCGNELDRDKNSAINIMNRFLSQNALWTGYQSFIGNLRQTGLPVRVMHSQEAPCDS